MLIVFFALAAYLVGSIPTAYLAARWLRGIDIRQRGSGQVGGSNAWHSVSRKVGIAVVVLDVIKGAMVVLVARMLGVSPGGQAIAAVAAIAGHNWSVFLRFGGGRGIATLGGAILILAPRETAVVAVFCVLGLVIRSFPACVVFGVASLPITARLLGEPNAIVAGLLVMFVLVLIKRMVPKWSWPRHNPGQVLFYRALFDRDVRSRDAWVKGAGASAGRAGDGLPDGNDKGSAR